MKIVFLFVISILMTLCLPAQVNTDSVFNVAILDARAGKYEEALKNADLVLNTHPDRFDVMVFSANVLSWQGNYQEALAFIQKAYEINPQFQELYDSWLNILLWSKDYKKLLEISEIAIMNKYTNIYNTVLKKTLAYIALGDYNQGILLIQDNKNLLDTGTIKQLYNKMQMHNKVRAITASYTIDAFDDTSMTPHHFFYLDYSFKLKKNTLIPRVNFANRYGLNDLQIEADYYHVFSKGSYAYFNYGTGLLKELFPEHRAGVEYYFPIANTMDLSLGGRFLYSNDFSATILTGHLGKYYRNLWFSLRPFYVFHKSQNTLTTVFNTRYYAGNPINFWGMELIYGNSPDDHDALSNQTENLFLSNYRFKIEKNTALLRFNELKLSAGYSYEEYFTDKFRNKFTLEILFKHKF